MRRRSMMSLLVPLILIGMGILLLLNTLGVLPWSIWGRVAQLWPVIVILAGLSLLGRALRRR